MATIPTARDLMGSVKFTFSPEMDVLEAIELLHRQGESAAPVVDERGALRGMLTEKDSLRVLAVSAFHRPRGNKVADLLSPVTTALSPDAGLFEISELFLQTNFTMLPVLEGEKLVGCVSRQQVLGGIMALTRARRAEEERIEQIEERSAEAVERPSSIEEMQRAFASHSRDQLVRRLGRKN